MVVGTLNGIFISRGLKNGMTKAKADFLIESAFEVANLIGGVYTVISSKSNEMRKYYGKEYYVMGPYIEKYAKIELDEKEPPDDLAVVFKELEPEGIICHYGIWLIAGEPQAILVDYKDRMADYKNIKKRVNKDHGIDFRGVSEGYKKRTVLSDSLSKLLEKLLKLPRFADKKGVLHQHISGSPGIPLLDAKKNKWPIGLVATAHSTRLGRDIASSNEDLFREINDRMRTNKSVRPKREYGYGHGTSTEHQYEKACATACDVFTTVSEITSRECQYILGRKADIVTPNGIITEKFPTIEERAMLHKKSKEKIWEFLEAYFLPYYPIDVESSLLMMTSGRYEFHTKGYDVFIHALGKLNYVLKEEKYPKNIFVFIFVMGKQHRKRNYEVLQNLSNYEQIGEYIGDKMPELEKKAIDTLVHGEELDKKELFSKELLMETKKLMVRFMKPEHRRPPLCALRMGNNDVIFNTLKSSGLLNRAEDKVKVVVYPSKISVGDGLLSMNYHDAIAGMHLGVFPSSYEPWGYTPLETAAFSVLSITTDLAGFGRFVKKNTDQRTNPGVRVLRRDGRNYVQCVDELEEMLHWFSKLPRSERMRKKLQAKRISELADWRDFVTFYIDAENLAVGKYEKRRKK